MDNKRKSDHLLWMIGIAFTEIIAIFIGYKLFGAQLGDIEDISKDHDGLLKLLSNLIPLLLGGPFALAVWHWRDQNKTADIENVRLDIKTKDQNAREDRSLLDIRELIKMIGSKETQDSGKVPAIHLLAAYLAKQDAPTAWIAAFSALSSFFEKRPSPGQEYNEEEKNPNQYEEMLENSSVIAEHRTTELTKAIAFALRVQKSSLNNLNWSELELFHFDLSGAKLANSDFRRARFIKADFSFSNSEKAKFQAADLYGSRLEEANLVEASFWYANLAEATLQGAHLLKANFEGAHLRGAVFRKADLQGANFQEANIHSADLEETFFGNATFTNAKYNVGVNKTKFPANFGDPRKRGMICVDDLGNLITDPTDYPKITNFTNAVYSIGPRGTKFPENFGDPRKRGMICVNDEGKPINDPTVYPEEPAEEPEE